LQRSNAPYASRRPGLAAGSYTLTAVATDGSGLSRTSAPVNITVTNGSGQPYGLTSPELFPFYNMRRPCPALFRLAAIAALARPACYNTPSMTPTNGLIPYSPNTPLWSDVRARTAGWRAI